MSKREPGAAQVGLPPRPFLYTLDQIAVMTGITETRLLQTHCFLEQRSLGSPGKHLLKCRNIAARDERPDWRILEAELIRWMKVKGFRYYEVGRFTS